MVHRALLVMVLLVSAFPASPASADSDFWEAVRNPGLREYRAHISASVRGLSRGLWVEALREADAALELLPDRAEGHVHRGRALGELDRLVDSVAAYRRALELDPEALDRGDTGAHAARIMAEAGEVSSAADILARTVAQMPPTALRQDLYALLGDLRLTLGPEMLGGALRAYREALRGAFESSPRAQVGLALALLRGGEVDEARAVALTVAARGGLDGLLGSLPVPDAEKAARRGVILDAAGDRAGAQTAWRAAQEHAPWRSFAERAARASPFLTGGP